MTVAVVDTVPLEEGRSQASTIRLALQPLQILPPPPELLPPPVPPRDEEVVVELPAAGGVLVGEGVEGDGTGVGAGGEGGVGAVVAVQAAVVSLAGDQIKSNQLSTYPSEMLGTGGKDVILILHAVPLQRIQKDLTDQLNRIRRVRAAGTPELLQRAVAGLRARGLHVPDIRLQRGPAGVGAGGVQVGGRGLEAGAHGGDQAEERRVAVDLGAVGRPAGRGGGVGEVLGRVGPVGAGGVQVEGGVGEEWEKEGEKCDKIAHFSLLI